jgi:serine/threonine-protein kinase RsbW
MNMPTVDESWTWQRDLRLASEERLTMEALQELLREMDRQHWSEHDVFCVSLAVCEALVNAVRHGNNDDPTKTVQFISRISPQVVHVEIADEGSGFDPKKIPDCTDSAHLDAPGGRGVLLMKAFMSRVAFKGCGNRVIMERDRTPDEGLKCGEE